MVVGVGYALIKQKIQEVQQQEEELKKLLSSVHTTAYYVA